MTDWRTILTSLGIDDASTIAGFAGGLVNVLRLSSPNALKVLTTTISGALIANYLGSAIAKTVNLPPIPTAFVVGFMGVQIVDMMIAILAKKFNGSNNSGGPRDVNAR